MSEAGEADDVAMIRARLNSAQPAHAAFVGPPIDLAALTPAQLGELWPTLQRAAWAPGDGADASDHARNLAYGLLRQARESELAPLLNETSALEVFRLLAPGQWKLAAEHVGWLAQEPSAALNAELLRILGPRADWPCEHGFDAYQALVLARTGGDVAVGELRAVVHERYADSRYRLDEFESLLQLGTTALLALAGSSNGYYWPPSRDEIADPAIALSAEAAYLEFTRQALESAARHVAAIHAGELPYRADGALHRRRRPGDRPRLPGCRLPRRALAR